MNRSHTSPDHIAQSEYDLKILCEGDDFADDPSCSPYDLSTNTCQYYEPSTMKDILCDANDKFSLFCLNCQGLIAHWDAFYNLLHEMGNDAHSFDVIGITEIFSMNKGQCSLPGYHPLEFAVRNYSNSSKGGVELYIKDSYHYELRQDLSTFIPNIFESIFIELKLNKKRIIIGTVYRPNTYPKADIDIFMHTMLELQNIISRENKEVYILGDVNMDLLKFANHSKTGEYLENTFSQGFLPLITKPTRVSSHSATLIDHIYTNKKNITSTSGIVITDVADHFGIFTLIELINSNDNTKPTSNVYRSFSQANMNNFNNILSQANYTHILDSTCANTAYDKFMEIYLKSFNTAFPLKQMKIRKKYLKRSPWITNGLLQSSITKSKLLTIKIKRPSTQNINRYKQFCSLYNKLMRKAKIIYYQDAFQRAKHDIKQTWILLKSAINSKNYHNDLPEYFNHNTIAIKDKSQIANLFNTFFANIDNNISENVPPSQHKFYKYLDQSNNNSMYLDPVDSNDIKEVVSKIKTKSSVDNNNISTKTMKASIAYVINPLTHIINLSLSTGVVPTQMKIAKVIPIFKTGDKTEFNNYRPISMLPVFSKILEKIIAKKLMSFLEGTNQLYTHQYGFRARHSTTHPVIHLLNQIANANDKSTNFFTMATFLDLSKAFDTISHDILLKQLENLGIRGVANTWVKSYLTGRKQYMDIYGVKSHFENITCGVPQGSILGPMLFLLYINDIKNSTSVKVLCFADDTTCSYSSANISHLYNTMNTELEKLNQWFRANKLCLNITKTKYIIFRPTATKQIGKNEKMYIDNQEIERISDQLNTKSFKFLGLEIDEKLSWKKHINNVCTKISRANYIINKVKNTIPKHCLLTLYQSIIQCHVNFGLQIWGSSSLIEKNIQITEKINAHNK